MARNPRATSTLTGLTRSGFLLLLALACACDGTLDLVTPPGGLLGPDGKPIPGTVANPAESPSTQRPVPSLHRLNRLEYNNSVRDLLGTRLTPADEFPPDASINGFDNAAGALNITPALMDRYVAAAGAVVADSFADRPAFSTTLQENDPRLTYNIDRDANSIGGIVRLRNGVAQGAIDVPTTGPHTLVVRVQGVVNGAVAAPRLRVALAGQNFDFDVPRAMQNVEFPIELAAGTHAVSLQPLAFEENAAENRGNDILFDFLTLRTVELVEGPARSLVLSCDPSSPDQPDCAATVVRAFAKRAWRRPLSTAETSRLDQLVAGLQTEGESPVEAVKLALRAILTSPKFLYRFRTVEDSDAPELLDPFVVATRLSYFVWSTTPGDRLLAAAEDGTLSTPAGIRSTVAWMLDDPRASALADGFAEQWLDLRHLELAAPSPEIYPEFSPAVKEAMTGESKLFFLDYLGNDMPVSSMLQPDFAYRDRALAALLGLPGPEGDGFERFDARPGDRRGVLALTAWLTARSDSQHPSPIRRGSWIADNMLCTPVPPPPAGLDVPPLAAEDSGTVRERLEQHRSDPTCASCHSHLDVLGIGFEVFDGVGRHLDDPQIDAVGELPDGTAFRGADQMAAALDQSAFVSCVSKKLFTYALGRVPTPDEMDAVLPATEPVAITLTLPDLITSIVLSPAFSSPKPLE